MKLSLPLRVPRGLPPVYHPFEGDRAQCGYCDMPRDVHPVDDPLRVIGAMAHYASRDHADKDDCIVCVAARPVLVALATLAGPTEEGRS